jgi:hypothetical protein
MNIPTSALYCAVVIALGVSSPALAGTNATAMAAHDKVVTLQYQSGGNTPASRERLAEAAKADDYDLQIHLPKIGGDYRDMTVMVTNANNLNVLNARAGGPLFYARLPKGNYTVKVDAGHKEALAKDIKVSPNHTATVRPTLRG